MKLLLILLALAAAALGGVALVVMIAPLSYGFAALCLAVAFFTLVQAGVFDARAKAEREPS